MKIKFLCLLSCFCYNSAFAQNTYNLIEASATLSNKTTVSSAIKASANTFYALGTTQDSLYIAAASYSCTGKNIFLTQTDNSGNVNWSRFIKFNSTYVSLGSLVYDANNNVYITANIKDGLEVNGQSYTWSGNKYAVIKYNAAGSFQWMSTLSTDPTLSYTPTVCINNNELILAVTVRDSLITNGQNLFFNDNKLNIGLVKMSLSGQVSNVYALEGTGDVVTVRGNPVIHAGNQLILACKAFNGGTLKLNGNIVLGGNNAQSGFFILKTDPLFTSIAAHNFVTASRYANTNYTTDITALSGSPSGSVYLVGTFVDTLSFGSLTIYNRNIPNPIGLGDNFLLALDNQLQAKWLKRIGTLNDNDWISGIVADNAGKLFITGNAGGNFKIDTQTVNVPANIECYIARLDTNGIMLNSKLSVSLAPGGIGLAMPLGLELLSDGELLVFGNTNADIVFGADTLWRKSIESGFIWRVNFNPTKINYFEKDGGYSTVYPNPATDDFYIKLNLPEAKKLKIQILSITGYGVFRIPIQYYSNGSHTIRLPFSNVPAGAYICQIINEQNEITHSHKIIKQ